MEVKTHAVDDLRTLAELYDRAGLLHHVSRRVSSENELMAVMKKTGGTMPVLFHKVDDYECPVVTGLGGTRALLAASMGITQDRLREHLASAITHPLPCQTVTQAPCQEKVIQAPFALNEYFPVLRHYEMDNGRFVISGMLIVKSEDGSRYYTSVRRMWYKGGSEMTLLITSREMQQQIALHERLKKPLDIALVFGLVPGMVLGSQISTHLYNADKLAVTGALLGAPLRVVHCKTVDLVVPAAAQVVLEGNCYPWEKHTEGPFGEMAFYYGKVADLPLCRFTCMTMQKKPLWQTFFPSGQEEKIPMAIAREVNLFDTVRMTVPGVREVYLTPGGAGRYIAVLQLHKETEGDGRQAVLAAFASDKDLKYAIAVDEDVNIYDPDEREWAISTRVQAEQDTFIVPRCLGSPLEASHNLCGATDKVGIDATKPLGAPKFARTHVIGEENIKLSDYFDKS